VKGAAMEITIRHVLEVSPQLAELLGRLLARVAMQSTAGAAQQAAPAPINPGGCHVAECEDANTDERRPDVGTAPAALDPAPGAAPAPADHIADAGKMAAPEGPQRGEWRTAERFALLQKMYPAGVDLMEIRAVLAAVEGPPLPEHQNRIAHWARDRGLSRPSDGLEPWRTPARAAILKATWEAGVDVSEIAERMRALPGGEVKHRSLSVWAAAMGLKRPQEYKDRLARERMVRVQKVRWGRAPAAAAQDGAAMERVAAAAGSVSDPPARPVAVVPEPARVAATAPAKPPPLPDAVDGLVRASFREIRAWAAHYGIRYDGGNADVVNRRRAGLGLPPVAQCEVRTMADSARAA